MSYGAVLKDMAGSRCRDIIAQAKIQFTGTSRPLYELVSGMILFDAADTQKALKECGNSSDSLVSHLRELFETDDAFIEFRRTVPSAGYYEKKLVILVVLPKAAWT